MTDDLTPPRRRRPLRRATGVVLVLLVAALATAGWRLTRGPVDLPAWVVARAEARLGAGLAPTALTLGGVSLDFDTGALALGLRLRGAELARDGATLLRLPDARVELDARALAAGRLRPTRIGVEGLSLRVARDAEGRLNLGLGGGGGGLPDSWAGALESIDAVLSAPAVAALDELRIDGVRLDLSDAVTGLSQQIENGSLVMRRAGQAAALDLVTELPLSGGGAARLTATLERRVPGEGAMARFALVGLPVGRLAEALPNVPALSLGRGTLSTSAAMTLSEDGVPGPLRGQVQLSEAQLTGRPRFALDRARLGFAWQPGSGRIALEEVAASSDDLALAATGQILLEDGLVGPVQVQLRLGETVFDPEGMFDRRVAFDEGLIEARLTQAPLALRVGQAMVTGPSATARASGRLRFRPEGLEGALRVAVPQMPVEDLKALWPREVQPQAQRWFDTNLLGGTARDVVAALRLAPGAAPEVLGSFTFADGTFRYMRFMPPGEGAAGAAQLDGDRFSIRLDAGTVPGRGPSTPEGVAPGRIDLAGTRFVIPDARQRPPRGELSLVAAGAMGDVLDLMDNRPFRLLSRLDRTRDLVSGAATATVSVSLPLRPGNAPADIVYEVAARLTGVESTTLVPNRSLAAEALALRAVPGLVEITGQATLDGVPFDGRWWQVLPPPSEDAIDPNAPPPPPQPLPEPGRLAGRATLTPEGLARLGISVGAIALDGATAAQVEVALPRGAPPQLSLRSDLSGLSVGLPAIAWSKPAGRAAEFALEATLGATPEVTRIALDAPGLEAAGRIVLRQGGGLERAAFDRVRTGFFTGPLVLTGRGAGRSPAVAIRGGAADLRRALLSTGGGGGGDPAPLEIVLDRLQVTEGIALTDMRARLRGGAGEFTARVNGGTPVEGVLAPQGDGSAVQIRTGDGGGVLRSAGLFQDARGGALTMTLRPTGQTGVYAGALRGSDLRVRDAPALASLLQALSVVGILEQLGGEGLVFQTVESDFTLRPSDIVVRRASAVGPSMSITADGVFDLAAKRMDMQGVISPIYLVNGLFGALFARRDEGLFGFTYRLTGPAADPQVSVNPLSILTPGVFRDIFRRAPPT
ncbi:AsmA-like C-terminal region-containing protein [Jannaschia ovalis]|uniref:AsmA-like C-terminal region-containing protein n=1 Tax=Jannaschia ovalis TaxID=3038773 RepID=A0ABY8LC66_9RHOB|nr:AsmA-like C-terminal region-containing protein [Jannaschia sp. GRR-S6-38]WGH78212.1 AsmA-like C-terminal region-containing protein [Jannaschia sp. GRR-S6-38]